MPIQVRTHVCVAFTLLVLACGLFACSQWSTWPPDRNGVVYELDTHESELLALSEEMRKDGLGSVIRQDTNEIQYVTPPRLASARRRKYRKLFEAVGPSVWAVFQDDSHTRFQIELPHDSDLYSRFDLERGSRTNDAVDCDSSLRARPCGHCAEPLRDDWILSYFWVSYDLGRTNFEEGRNLPHQELSRRREEAVQKCLAEFKAFVTNG
jgi:hypothetical protein